MPRKPTLRGRRAATLEVPLQHFLTRALWALALSACASWPAPRLQYDADVLTGDQISRTQAASVYDAVLRLRPAFFRARGPSSVLVPGSEGPALWVDQTHIGDLRELRDMPVGDVDSIRFWPAHQAATRFGSRFSNGVLVVTTRP